MNERIQLVRAENSLPPLSPDGPYPDRLEQARRVLRLAIVSPLSNGNTYRAIISRDGILAQFPYGPIYTNYPEGEEPMDRLTLVWSVPDDMTDEEAYTLDEEQERWIARYLQASPSTLDSVGVTIRLVEGSEGTDLEFAITPIRQEPGKEDVAPFTLVMPGAAGIEKYPLYLDKTLTPTIRYTIARKVARSYNPDVASGQWAIVAQEPNAERVKEARLD